MTTSDYLESLQNDLQTIKTSLNLDEETNFTNIAQMTANGEITKGGSGADLSEYFNNELSVVGSSSIPSYKNLVIKVPDNLVITIPNCQYMFSGYPATTLPKLSVADGVTITSTAYMFNSCRSATEIDLSTIDLSSVTSVNNMFYYCKSLSKIDLRTLETANITNKSQMLYNVPYSCLIIVKDSDAKTWFNSNFGSWTNIQTVEEYEASL